jgi:transcriptional regulator with XRE-family HTH domain
MADPTRLLRRALKRAGWTQAELARRTGLDKTAVSRLVNGERGPSLKLAVKLEQLLDIPVSSWVQ